MPETQTQCCGTCRYMKRSGLQNLDQGVCRRFPPTATSHLTSGKLFKLTAFPIVDLRDWGCHEYQPKIENTSDAD